MGIEIRALTNFKTAQLYLHSVIEFRFRTSFAIPCDSASITGRRRNLEIYSGSLSLRYPWAKQKAGRFNAFFAKILYVSFQKFFDSAIKLVELYSAVEKLFDKNF